MRRAILSLCALALLFYVTGTAILFLSSQQERGRALTAAAALPATVACGLWLLRRRAPAIRSSLIGPIVRRSALRTGPPRPGPTRTPETHPPQAEELLRLLQGRPGGMSLRDLCVALWPDLRWCALHEGEDSASEWPRAGGSTAAEQVHAVMMSLVMAGRAALGPPRPDEVDATAAIVYEAAGSAAPIATGERGHA